MFMRREYLDDDSRICLEVVDRDGFVLRRRGSCTFWFDQEDGYREIVWLSMCMELVRARQENLI